MAGRRALRGDVGEPIRLLQMAEEAIEAVGEGQKEDRRHRRVRRLPRQIPQPRLSLDQRQDQI